jgi:hypothetical protein
MASQRQASEDCMGQIGFVGRTCGFLAAIPASDSSLKFKADDLSRADGGPGNRMRLTTKPETEQEQALTLNRRLGDLRTIASKLKRSRMTPLQVCEALIDKRLADRAVRAFFPAYRTTSGIIGLQASMRC